MAGYIGTQAVSVNTTSATISDDLSVGDDLTVTDDATIGGTALVTGVLTTTAAAVFNAGFTSNADTNTFTSANATDPVLIIKNTTNDADSARIRFVKDKGAAGADDDKIGTIEFFSDNAAQEQTQFALIRAEVAISNDGAEGGKLRLQVATHDGEMQSGLILADGSAEDEIDVQIAKGSASLTTIAGTLAVTDGSASAPAISNTGDTNTGILFPSADTIAFSTGGTERLRLSASSLNFLTGSSADISASNQEGVSLKKFSGQGLIRVGNTATSGKNCVEFFNGNGQVGTIATSSSATAYNTSSDYRLKENVDYTWDATTRLKQLKPARFNFIVDDTNTLVDGFLAHETQAVVPAAVHGTHNEVDDDGVAVMQGIDQSKLVPLLVKTIQELEARITALEDA